MTKADLVKAFTKDPDEGNPAGVVIGDIDESEMREITESLGLSTTAFLKPISANRFVVRFFSPSKETGLCVHALIAAAHVAIPWKSTQSFCFQTRSDEVEVSRSSDGALLANLPAPVVGDLVTDIAAVASALNVDPAMLSDDPIQVFSTGKPKILVPFKTHEALKAMNPDLDLLRELCVSNGAEGMFAFTNDTISTDADFYARHYNPLTLQEEDPICGVGSGALGGYLQHHDLLHQSDFRVEMGYTTNRPGTVFVDTSARPAVGGFAVRYGERQL